MLDRAEAVGRQLVEAFLGALVGTGELLLGGLGLDDHVVDEDHPLTPVVEGGQLPDDGQDGVGVAEVVGGHGRKVLDLADHVVAEVADQPGVEGRQVGQVWGFERLEHGIEGRQDATGAADPATGDGVEIDRSLGGHPGTAGGDGGQRVAADERVAAPALTPLDRLEEEPGAVGPLHYVEEGAHRGDGVGHQLAPHRHDAVLGGQGDELLGTGARGPRTHRSAGGGHCRSPNAR